MVCEWVPEESRNGHRGAEVTDRYELPDGWDWDLNSGLPQGQLMFLTPVSFLRPDTLFWPPLASPMDVACMCMYRQTLTHIKQKCIL